MAKTQCGGVSEKGICGSKATTNSIVHSSERERDKRELCVPNIIVRTIRRRARQLGPMEICRSRHDEVGLEAAMRTGWRLHVSMHVTVSVSVQRVRAGTMEIP